MSQTPTIGRRVYYWPAVNELAMLPSKYAAAELPHWEAGIVWVEPQMADGRWTINAMMTLPAGSTYFRENVILADDRESASPGDCYWMPYQVKNAASA